MVKLYENMIRHNPKTWSTIIKKHCQHSSRNFVRHHQHGPKKTWSTIVNKHGQQSLSNKIANRQKTLNNRCCCRNRCCRCAASCAFQFFLPFQSHDMFVASNGDSTSITVRRTIYTPLFFNNARVYFAIIRCRLVSYEVPPLVKICGIT
jgi:hypothetical protein